MYRCVTFFLAVVTVGFVQSNYSVTERGGAVTVCLQVLTEGEATQVDIWVTLSPTDGSALGKMKLACTVNNSRSDHSS